jgi:hypothetical protein
MRRIYVKLVKKVNASIFQNKDKVKNQKYENDKNDKNKYKYLL